MSIAPGSRTSRILLESLAPHGSPSTGLGFQEWEALWTAARDHCLTPYLHKRWTDSGFIASLPAALSARFADASLKNAERIRQLILVLDELHSALQEKAVPILVSKGLTVAHLYYGDPGLRVLYDLDIHVMDRDRACAMDVLRGCGYVPFDKRRVHEEQTLLWQPKEYFWNEDSVFDPNQPHFVELHTHAWSSGWHGFRLECNLDLWEGSRLGEVAGVQLRAPSEESLLIHLAVHYACNVLESNARLMHLLDIMLVLDRRAGVLDWDMMLRKINDCRAAPFCFIALDLARQAGAVGIPAQFLGALAAATPPRIADWLARKGIEEAAAMNLRHRDRSLIHFLHWNMASGWSEKTCVLYHSLRSPWLEGTGMGRWKFLGRRLIERMHYLAQAGRS